MDKFPCYGLASDHLEPTPERVSFFLTSYLATKKNEQEYIRKIVEFLLILLLPSRYSRCQPVRHLLREIISNLVVYNLIDTICDPDYINRKLIGYLQWQQKEMEHHNRTYSYAETFEDFIRIIQDCGNVEDIKRIRYCIVREIIQATAINNFKKAKGIELDKEFSPQTKAKGDLLQARNLKRYINQLQYAKSLCEKNIKALGGTNYTSFKESLLPTDVSPITGKVLSHSVIMETPYCREYFTKYLEKEESYSLIGFWEAVEEMKHSDKNKWHQLGNEIVQLYINNPNSSVKLSKNILKGIESFMMANKGPEAFFQAQDDVYKLLEERFYPSFIVSEIYDLMISNAEKAGIDFAHMAESSNESEVYESELPNSSHHDDLLEETSPMSLSEHSHFLKLQLGQLDEKLSIKRQALQAIHNTQKSDIKMISVLEKEIEDMKIERYHLESHIIMTTTWMEHLGYWKASVEKVEIKKETEKAITQCTVVVHLGSDPVIINNDISEGWRVVKSINDFRALRQKLSLIVPSLKKIELPNNKPHFKSQEQQYLDRAKVLLQNFLTVIMKNDDMNKSETLYIFLSPSPDHLKYPLEPRKKSIKGVLMQFFKSAQSSAQSEGSDEDELLFLDDIDSKEDRKDSIAENLYTLIGEIFEVKGIFGWVRKTLITIVQITFGKTINRQLRETVAWITSESIVLYYLQMFRDTMWPDKEIPASTRTDKEKLETREMAKQQLLNNIPDVLGNLLGQQNTKKGMTKVFEALQDKRLNKQIFYNVLEAFLYEFAPELQMNNKV
ncbi:sorting nexin-25-like [Centruroides sculpturatus]|uniref:sorting nexin-25-like n=1 Tax=Centruroides sculpturatus TaxID=218467 RepID=UPI000C6E34B7|nr:sorting nexin-25-like [Centruroides sculpturatus]